MDECGLGGEGVSAKGTCMVKRKHIPERNHLWVPGEGRAFLMAALRRIWGRTRHVPEGGLK